ncbi:MAG: bifunctional riboflavin kinase/FAD synthetase [Clostridia bacterium]|nr:bifunctional riboflavin kinase/FAD synthetase [Clostridia bacterium]
MEIYDLKTMQRCEIDEPCVVALGTFDGCHIGHMSIFTETFYSAKRNKMKSVVYTFDSIPKSHKNSEVRALTTLNEKIKIIKKHGIDYVAIDKFENVRNLSPKEFFDNILVNTLNAKMALCGFNYRFGNGALAAPNDLARFFENIGGSVKICDKVMLENEVLSSTLVRSLIENGEVEKTLNYIAPYSIFARVEYGKALGRRLGFPTINQKIPDGKVLPKRGVYITECELGEDVYPSITNVGVRPTTDGDYSELNMETYIIGYDGNLYGSCVRVNFYKYLRGEIKFDSIDALTEQISKDATEAKAYFK